MKNNKKINAEEMFKCCKEMYINLIDQVGYDIVNYAKSREFERGNVNLYLCDGVPSAYLSSDGKRLFINMSIPYTGINEKVDITNDEKFKIKVPAIIKKMHDVDIFIMERRGLI